MVSRSKPRLTLSGLVLGFILLIGILSPLGLAHSQDGDGNLRLLQAEAVNRGELDYRKPHVALSYVGVTNDRRAVMVVPQNNAGVMNLGAPLYGVASDPALVYWGNEPTDFFVFVRGQDNALWYTDATGAWFSLGGNVTSNPDATLLDNQVAVFVRGQDMQIYYRLHHLPSKTWSDWLPIHPNPYGVTSAPAAFGWMVEPQNHILGGVIARNEVGTLSWSLLTRNGWSNWTVIPGSYYITAYTDIDVSAASYLNLAVVVIGRDDLLYTQQIDVTLGGWRPVAETTLSNNPAISMQADDDFRVSRSVIKSDFIYMYHCATLIPDCAFHSVLRNQTVVGGVDTFAWGELDY